MFSNGGAIVKKTIGWVVKTIFLVLLVTWMVFFVIDYFRAKDGVKPVVCFSAVSYTHLDVYKRQVRKLSQTKCRWIVSD